MKANIETVEPAIRPLTTAAVTKTVRSTPRPLAFAPALAQPVLFHAWRA